MWRATLSRQWWADVAVGLVAGLAVLPCSFLLTALLIATLAPDRLQAMPRDVRNAVLLGELGLPSLAVGLWLGRTRGTRGLWSAVMAGVSAALSVLLFRFSLGPEATYNPVVFGWPGMIVPLWSSALGGALARFRSRMPLGRSIGAPPPPVRTALWAALLWFSLEVAVRTIGALVVGERLGNLLAGDALALLVAFPAIALGVAWDARRRGEGPSTWEYRWNGPAVLAGACGGLVMVGLLNLTAAVDQALFGLSPQLPTPMRDALQRGGVWMAALLLLANGVAAPVSEELVWRGVIQTALARVWRPSVALIVTAVVFALKHVVVDASAQRLTTLLVFGVVVGAVRARWGTASSTITHVVANLAATTIALATV